MNSMTRSGTPAKAIGPAYKMMIQVVVISIALLACPLLAAASDDPYGWLEDITGDRSLAWVRQQDARTQAVLEASPNFEPIRARLLEIFNSKQRIPFVTKHGEFLYNFWRDAQHVRGIWRRTTMEEFRKADPAWETVLDLDQLAASEKKNWVWKGEQVLKPDYDRSLVLLSSGGADAVEVREFDLNLKQFVPAGFEIPESKTDVSWRNRDALYVGTDFGPGSMTDSGYPRLVKEWKRGTPLAQARTVFEGKATDVDVSADVVHDHGHVYEFINQGTTFFEQTVFIRRGDDWVRIDKPADADVDTYSDYLLLRLKSDWTVNAATYHAGTLLADKVDAYLAGKRQFTLLFEPTARRSLSSFSGTKNYLLLNELDNVSSRPVLLNAADGTWTPASMEVPQFGSVDVSPVDSDESDEYFELVEDFLTPSSLYLGTAGKPGRDLLKSLPAFFDSAGLQIEQHEAISKDGTRIPYFQVSRRKMALDGNNVTLLTGYGGFEISLQPDYQADIGAAWLERGGVFVVANIRGGGEFGPDWHNAARKEHRQRAYDDFIAVAESLIDRKVTSPQRLGIEGGSNGGLLMGVMLTERPDLFGAVACESPLLDMRRYNKLLAGASWVDEYGNPDDPADWAYIGQYSPYQNVMKDRHYPPVLFTTSTRDDRVHPGHARKMAAKMEDQGHDVLFYENIEGGHRGAANNEQAAFMKALDYTFLWNELGKMGH
jgi:prolyl oligopeptidase